jgi:hypothetical protein
LFPELDADTQKTVDELRGKKIEAEAQRRGYHEMLKKLVPPPKDPRQLEFNLEPSVEMLFSLPSSDRKDEASKQKVARVEEFGTDGGLRSTYDTTKRFKFYTLRWYKIRVL